MQDFSRYLQASLTGAGGYLLAIDQLLFAVLAAVLAAVLEWLRRRQATPPEQVGKTRLNHRGP